MTKPSRINETICNVKCPLGSHTSVFLKLFFFVEKPLKEFQQVKIQQNALKVFIILMTSTYMFRPAPAILRVVVMKYQVQFLKCVDKIKKRAKYLVKCHDAKN
jgi:hypothetical protein